MRSAQPEALEVLRLENEALKTTITDAKEAIAGLEDGLRSAGERCAHST